MTGIVYEVSIYSGYKTLDSEDGRVRYRTLRQQVDTCIQCVADCEGLDCEYIDEEHFVGNRADEDDCPHCGECEYAREVVEGGVKTFTHCKCNSGNHLCEAEDGYPCGDCLNCRECGADCCNRLSESKHYSAAYRVSRDPLTGMYVCALGHVTDKNDYERLIANRQMEANGTPMLV